MTNKYFISTIELLFISLHLGLSHTIHFHFILKLLFPGLTQVQNEYIKRAKLYNWDSAGQTSQGKQHKRS